MISQEFLSRFNNLTQTINNIVSHPFVALSRVTNATEEDGGAEWQLVLGYDDEEAAGKDLWWSTSSMGYEEVTRILTIKDSAISPNHMIDQIVIAWTEGNLSVLDFKSTTVARRSPIQLSFTITPTLAVNFTLTYIEKCPISLVQILEQTIPQSLSSALNAKNARIALDSHKKLQKAYDDLHVSHQNLKRLHAKASSTAGHFPNGSQDGPSLSQAGSNARAGTASPTKRARPTISQQKGKIVSKEAQFGDFSDSDESD